MQLKLIRKHGAIGFTHGQLFVDGAFFCDTLEDEERKVKIEHETAIPVGAYKVIINYSNRFKRLMPLLLDVPNFTGVRIHNGNFAKHSSGCVLTGVYSSQGYIRDSRDTFARLFKVMQEAIKRGETITIEVV